MTDVEPSTLLDRLEMLSFRALGLRTVVALWAVAVLAWLAFALIGGGSVNMAVGVTMAAVIISIVVAVLVATDRPS